MELVNFDNEIRNTVFLFIFAAGMLYIAKPAQLFNKNGKMKKFGSGTNKICFNYYVVTILFAIISFYILTYLN